jgi:hypothetical protein
VYRAAPDSVPWTYLAPNQPIGLGQQAGHLSPETVAATVLRELEQPSHLRQNVTISA